MSSLIWKKRSWPFLIAAGLAFLLTGYDSSDSFARTEKYRGRSDDSQSKTYSDFKYDIGREAPPKFETAPPPSEESIASWFSTGFSGFSLNTLKLLLPSFIQVSPESRLTGDLKWNVESFSQASVSEDVLLTAIRIVHPGLAQNPVDIPDLYLKGTIRWNRWEKTLSFYDLYVGRRGVMVRANGLISYQDATAVQLSLFLPETALQQALDALPAGLIPKLQGAQVAGSIAMDMIFSADPRRPDLAQFVPGIRIGNYALLEEPLGLNIRSLKSNYTHEIRKNGLVVRQILLAPGNPRYVPYIHLGEKIRQAILKAEDAGFFRHKGFDLEGIRQAMAHDLRTHGYVRGASTITQQVAKNIFLDGSRTLSRKLQEAMIAYALENDLGKERIFEIYANVIEWGVDVYGIFEAARHYFSKTPSSLTEQEAAFLASIIPNPRKGDFKKKTETFPQLSSSSY